MEKVRRNLVISAVNIRKGGTLTVLRDCLRYLSVRSDLRVTALVHKRELCDYPGIEYIEIPWSIEGWGKRLKCEYVTMKGISEKLQPVDLWLSLHDTTPNATARHQAVYCQTSFPFLKVRARDFLMDKKIPLFALFTKYAYKKNVHRNDFLIVQQYWLRDGLSKMLHVDRNRFIVAPPKFVNPSFMDTSGQETVPVFLYPASPDSHKNFELLCEAAGILEKKLGSGAFKVILTIDGTENKYASWVHKKWGHLKSIDFHGFMSKEDLYACYGKAACLVFPSRIETWGLPISEFKPSGKPMLLADLPYARESAAGAGTVSFFDINDAEDLTHQMELVISGKISNFGRIIPRKSEAPFAADWEILFALLLQDESTSTR